MSTRGDIRKAMKLALRRGWVSISAERKMKNCHHILEWTNGQRVTASFTPSDHRAMRNFLADMRRIERNALDNK
jgi:hypothetical protein